VTTVNKSKRIRCPQCGGRGIIEIPDNRKAFTLHREDKEEYSEEQRLPILTGTKDQCMVAVNIRNLFVQKAKNQYQAESFKTFIKLISYESHSIFWILNKDCNIGGLVGKIAVKNPTAFDLINSIK